MRTIDTLIIGAGAAGMMCAIEAGKRGRRAVLVEQSRKPGEKIRISGGGRCNFTNLHTTPGAYISGNPHFVKSALKRYTQYDFIDWIDRKNIAWHEKTLGQLFCDHSAQQIVDALVEDVRASGTELFVATTVDEIRRDSDTFRVRLSDGQDLIAGSVVVATGGKSIPKMGASGFAYDIARRFQVSVTETRPGLVPLTFSPVHLEHYKPLSGVSLDAEIKHGPARFREALLFTHRGLSGPVILQISSYWREGDTLSVCLLPDIDIFAALKQARQENGRQSPVSVLAGILPKRLAQLWSEDWALSGNIADYSDKALREIEGRLRQWRVKPTGSEGYRTAEVTLGGVDTHDLDSRTMQVKSCPNLYFIGEAVDVTGWLGGYNFQWAWSSGWCAGQYA